MIHFTVQSFFAIFIYLFNYLFVFPDIYQS